MIFQRRMPPKKLKTGTVITSLFENEKNNNIDDSDDDDEEKRKRSKREKKKDDKTFNCDICHIEDSTLPKFLSSDIKFLEEDEQIILKFKREENMKILCKRHYKNEILNWKTHIKSRSKCCNILDEHDKEKIGKKTRQKKSHLKDVTVKQAEDAKRYLGKKLIPFQLICSQCVVKFESKIEEMKLLESNPPVEHSFPEIDVIDEEFEAHTETDEDMGSEEIDVKEAILTNIQEKVQLFTKEQKVAIISIIPSSWSANEIAKKTGKPNIFFVH